MSIRIDCIKLGITNCYLIRQEGTLLVDCGEAGRSDIFRREADALFDGPPHIDLVILTHGHWDHIGTAPEILRITGAKLAMHRADAERVERGLEVPIIPRSFWAWWINRMSFFMGSHTKRPILTPDILFGQEDLSLEPYGIHGRVIHTPGHTPGSVSVLLEDGSAFVGDVAMSGFPALRSKAGMPIFAADPDGVVSSWKRLFAEPISTIYPAHGRPFPVEEMRKVISPQV